MAKSFTKSMLDQMLKGTFSYVTGEGMTNFCGDDLGDWHAAISKFRADIVKELSAEQKAAVKKRKDAEKLAEAKKKAVKTAEAAVSKAKKEAAKARKELSDLE